jgi:hypothetical protein
MLRNFTLALAVVWLTLMSGGLTQAQRVIPETFDIDDFSDLSQTFIGGDTLNFTAAVAFSNQIQIAANGVKLTGVVDIDGKPTTTLTKSGSGNFKFFQFLANGIGTDCGGISNLIFNGGGTGGDSAGGAVFARTFSGDITNCTFTNNALNTSGNGGAVGTGNGF